MSFNIDVDILKEFEEGLNTLYPERSRIPAKIIGFGEISTVFVINHPALHGYAFKRLPIFSDESEVAEYEVALNDYIDLLKDEIGIQVLETEGIRIKTSDGRIIYYIVQPVLRDFTLCNNFLHKISVQEAINLFKAVLLNLKRIWDFNAHSKDVKIGLDEQFSNWAIFNHRIRNYQRIRNWCILTSAPLFSGRPEGKR